MLEQNVRIKVRVGLDTNFMVLYAHMRTISQQVTFKGVKLINSTIGLVDNVLDLIQ